MTEGRYDSVAGPARGLFASGMVLGLGLGLVAGHLLLFAKSTRDTDAGTPAAEFPPFDPSAFAFSSGPDVDVPDDVSFSIAEVDESEEVGRASISDRTDGDELQFFPEAVSRNRSTRVATTLGHLDTDDGQSAKRTWLASADEIEIERPAVEAAESSTASDEVPQALQPLPGASPIDERTQQRERIARSIVDEELPDATQQERDVWCEVLQGLPADDIKGILRMRKHIGPENPFPAISALSPLITRRDSEPAIERPEVGESSVGQSTLRETADDPVHQELARIARHNRANLDTVGFKKLLPVLVEVPWSEAVDGPGIRMARVIRDMTPGDLVPTNRSLDVAVYGCGFLQVRHDDDIRYTRDGRLTIDEKGRLKLLSHADDWLLDPPIVVPPEATDVTIAENGRVAVRVDQAAEPMEIGRVPLWVFLNPELLQMDDTGMYSPTIETGQPLQSSTDDSLGGTLVQGHLEASNAGSDELP